MKEMYLDLKLIESETIKFGSHRFPTALGNNQQSKKNRYWLYTNDLKDEDLAHEFLKSTSFHGQSSFLGVDGVIVGLAHATCDYGAGAHIISLLTRGISNLGIYVDFTSELYADPANHELLKQTQDFLVKICQLSNGPILVSILDLGLAEVPKKQLSKIVQFDLKKATATFSVDEKLAFTKFKKENYLIFTLEPLTPFKYDNRSFIRDSIYDFIQAQDGKYSNWTPTTGDESVQNPETFSSRLGRALSPYPRAYAAAEKAFTLLQKVGRER